MKTFSVDEALIVVRKYLINDVATPFFVVVDDGDEYSDIVNGLNTLDQIHLSDYCANQNALPDFDKFLNKLLLATKNTLVIGLGESVHLSGNENTLARVKDLNAPSKIVVVCRGVRKAIKKLCSTDNKFDTLRRVCFLGGRVFFDVIKFSPSLNVTAEKGIKALLVRLERGATGAVFVNTDLPLKNIREVNTAYEAILQIEPTFQLPFNCVEDEYWAEYVADKNLESYGLFHWRNFLKLKLESTKDIYLKYVIESSRSYEIFKKRIFSALLDFDIKDKIFITMYNARKELLKDVKNNEIAEYVLETKAKDSERIFYLTDNTSVERYSVIETLDGSPKLLNFLEHIYPSLHEYLNDFSFLGTNGNLITKYFTEYKRLKLTNRIDQEFLNQVIDLAADGNRTYNCLKTRGEVLDSLNNEKTSLYWVDALGVEYIGYIQSRAKSIGMKIEVHIARANLPTITSLNCDFFDSWVGPKMQTKKLDEIKHNGEHNFNYETTKLPIHIDTELRIIDEVLEVVSQVLTSKQSDKFVIASDHGASRLAVINEQECKWEMSLKGKHSGRCCPCSDIDNKPEFATMENEFWVLANYDRFKGGRKASVEVHGGASLEEVIVPIIEIELFDKKISISNLTPVTTTSFKKNAEIILFSTSSLKNVSIRLLEQRYVAEPIGNQKHRVIFEDIKKTGKYIADVFEGDNLIGQIEFEIQRESAKTQDSDWF